MSQHGSIDGVQTYRQTYRQTYMPTVAERRAATSKWPSMRKPEDDGSTAGDARAQRGSRGARPPSSSHLHTNKQQGEASHDRRPPIRPTPTRRREGGREGERQASWPAADAA